VIHGSDNDAAVIRDHAWAPSGESLLVHQGCWRASEATPLVRAECTGVYTLPLSSLDGFSPDQPVSLASSIDCNDDTSPVPSAVVQNVLWSPGGESITVSTQAECSQGVWGVDITTGETTNLISCPFAAEGVQIEACVAAGWSPGGDRLAMFAVDDIGDSTVWVFDKGAVNPRLLSPWGLEVEMDAGLQWSPEGDRIAFFGFWPQVGNALWIVEVADPTKLVVVPHSKLGAPELSFLWFE
jgi:hypothetical protein